MDVGTDIYDDKRVQFNFLSKVKMARKETEIVDP